MIVIFLRYSSTDLAVRHTGKIFYDKLGFIYIEILNFVKRPKDLDTDLDKWVYALKHLTEFKTRPDYLSGVEFDQLFNLAKYANLTREEQDMYNASLYPEGLHLTKIKNK